MEDAFDTIAFLGIPYAAPPTGDRRWLAPIDPEPWIDVRTATHFGPACPQNQTREDGSVSPIGDEDCLHLNVWRPKASSSVLRPIMVYLHGGGNTTGATSEAIYDGAKFAATADVVLVTIDYRLSFLGWLYLEALWTGDPYGDSGNLGTLDILQALRWVQINGAAFGGDSQRVTVFGQSAGGDDAWSVIQSPLAAGLFHRAIAQSAALSYMSTDSAATQAESFLETLVVADGLATQKTAAAYIKAQGDVWVHDYLYEKTADQMLEVFATGGLGSYIPILDGVVMPTAGTANLITGDYNRVPLIIGSNSTESKTFMSKLYGMSESQFKALMSIYGDAQDEILKLYPRNAYSPASPYNQYTDIQDYSLELEDSEYIAWLVAPFQNTWNYHFEYIQLAPPNDDIFGAGHKYELPFVFGNMIDAQYATGTGPGRLALSERMMGYWGCFAATGDPSSCATDLPWPRFVLSGTAPYQRMVLNDPASVSSMPKIDFDRVAFWQKYNQSDMPPMTY